MPRTPFCAQRVALPSSPVHWAHKSRVVIMLHKLSLVRCWPARNNLCHKPNSLKTGG